MGIWVEIPVPDAPVAKQGADLLGAALSVHPVVELLQEPEGLFEGLHAELYGVMTGALNQAVKRNNGLFPKDFFPA